MNEYQFLGFIKPELTVSIADAYPLEHLSVKLEKIVLNFYYLEGPEPHVGYPGKFVVTDVFTTNYISTAFEGRLFVAVN